MADYIYLLQNRLTPAQWRAVEAVREAARTQGMPVFLVGGAVRDLTSGSPVRDLDFAVQGDPHALVNDLEGQGAAVAGENATFGSLYLTFRGGVRVEVGPTLSVSYPKPGQPETQPAVILDDLRRRDFTANAMAISLNEGSYGLLLDPLNGTADIENREFRLVSPYGFIEQPALLLRAARLTERLGWHLEERTQGRYETGKEENYIEALPQGDRDYEVEEVFHEEDPLTTLEYLREEGWAAVLAPEFNATYADRKGLDEVRDMAGQLEGQGLHPDLSAVMFPLVTAKMPEGERAALKKRFARQGFVRQIESLEARSKELAAQLTPKAAQQPSETWRLLMDADPEVVLYLAVHSRSGAIQAKFKAFLKDWPQMRQKLPYSLMQEMRITPELPGYDKLLDDLFFALIDGKLDTQEATRAFLEPYSPPAPPQVQVRRRPAKATRSRAKKAAAEEALDEAPEEPTEVEDESADAEEDADFAASAASDDEDHDDDDEEENEDEEQEPAPAPAKPQPVKPVKSAAAPGKKAKEAAVGQASAVKATESRPSAAVKVVPSKAIRSKDSAATAPDAKAKDVEELKSKQPAKAALPAKAVAVKKAEPVKVGAKGAAKQAVPLKAPAKKSAATKASSAAAPVKVAATKAAPPAKAVVVVKKAAVPAKAAKKAPVKGRGR